MPTIDLTAADFTTTIEREGVVLVDFWAAWCGPCRTFAPRYDEVSEEFPDVTFAKVDTETENLLAGSLGIRSIPTLMVLRDGILLYREAGAIPKETLRDLVQQAKALDMEKVRAEIEAEDAR